MVNVQPGPFHPWAYGTDCENPQGHQWYLLAEDTGGVEKRFLDNFGNVARWNGPFGVRLAVLLNTLISYS